MLKRISLAAIVALWCAFLVSSSDAQVTTWFRANFDVLGSANLYNFGNRYAQDAAHPWVATHLPTGGWNGTGGAHVTVKGCTAATGRPCNTSENQFNIGWQTPPIGTPLGRPFQIGDSAFLRFRIKFDPDFVYAIGASGAKFILWGQTRTTPNSRWIVHLFPPTANPGCTLGFPAYGDGGMGWTPPASIWYQAASWGLPSFVANSPFAGFTSHVNVGWSCNPAVLVHGSDRTPALKPQANGAAPVDGWYHLQFQATSGADGTADFRTWANNNNQATPSAEHLNMVEGLGVTGWSGVIEVGGYWGVGQSQDVGYTIDDFEAGGTFDPNWYPTGQPPPPTCTTTPDVSAITYTAAGGSKAVNVAANLPTCVWSSTEALSWLSAAPASVTGSGPVVVTADPNTGTATRVGTITVAGRVISVAQPGTPPPPCTFTVSPTSAQVAASGGSGTLAVTASAATCTWTGTSAAAWLTLSDGSGTGTGEVIYAAVANPGLSRSGVLTIGGQAVTISQDGTPLPTTLTTRCAVDVTTEIGTGAVTGIAVVQPCPPEAAAARGRRR